MWLSRTLEKYLATAFDQPEVVEALERGAIDDARIADHSNDPGYIFLHLLLPASGRSSGCFRRNLGTRCRLRGTVAGGRSGVCRTRSRFVRTGRGRLLRFACLDLFTKGQSDGCSD